MVEAILDFRFVANSRQLLVPFVGRAVKICLSCERVFASDAWKCPDCGWEPALEDGWLSFAPDLSRSNDGMNAGDFQQLQALEAGHFWFRSRNRLLQWAFGRYFPDATSFLEVGCGTGFVLSGLRQEFPALRLAGSEIYASGLRFAEERLPDVKLFQMDARRLPFDLEFDVIGAFDVLEHIEEDELVLGGLFRAIRPQGGLMLTVPQHPFLWSSVDEYACHKRRYTRPELIRKVQRAGFRIVRATSFVSLLLPLLLLSRWKRNRPGACFDPLAEYKIGRLTNRILEAALGVERVLIRQGISFPAGGSLLLVARRD
jgi:SAM-dependent methyltransferase